MIRTLMSMATAVVCAVVLLAGSANAQQSKNGDLARDSKAGGVRKIGFRLANWQTIHGNATQASKDTVSTLQKIGCEVRESDHGNHVDIKFRCTNWKSITVDNDEQSTQWHDWLVKKQFETIVVNPAKNSKLPTVRIRFSKPKTVHADSREQAASIKETFELIGCEVSTEIHGDHIDARIRCENWTAIGFPDSGTAHAWQDWFKEAGFETQHDHGHDQ